MKKYKDLTSEQKVVFDFIKYGSEGDFIQVDDKRIVRLTKKGTVPKCGIYNENEETGFVGNLFEAIEFLYN